MSAYAIELESKAVRNLKRIPRLDQERIVNRIEALATDPRPAACEKLQGQADAYRIRQGNYRVVYTIDDTVKIVTITKIGDRKDVYR